MHPGFAPHEPPPVVTGVNSMPTVSLGAQEDPDGELVANHLTRDVVFAAPDWSLEEAAAAMVRGGFRHLIVVEQGEIVGILSVRDVVRCWTGDGATSSLPASAATG